MNHLVTFACSYPMKRGIGNASATCASSTGRSLQVVPLSLFHLRKVESPGTSPSYLQILMMPLKSAVLSSCSQLNWD